MLNLSKIKPRFWDHQDVAAGPSGKPFSFRRKWKLIVLFTTVVTLTPLAVMTLMDYRLTHQAFESEAAGNTSRMVSNTWRSVSFFCPSDGLHLNSLPATTPGRHWRHRND